MQAIGLMLIAAFAVVACPSKARCEPVTLTFVHAAQTTHPAHEAAMQFAKRVEQRTGGQVKIEIFPAAELGSETEMAQNLDQQPTGIAARAGSQSHFRADASIS